MRVLTPWMTEPPVRVGWYCASTERNPETRRWWNGEYWSPPVSVDSPDDGRFERAKITRGESQDGIEWRGLHVDAMDDYAMSVLVGEYLGEGSDISRDTLETLGGVCRERAKALNARLRVMAIEAARKRNTILSERAPKWLRQGVASASQHPA